MIRAKGRSMKLKQICVSLLLFWFSFFHVRVACKSSKGGRRTYGCKWCVGCRHARKIRG